MGWDLVAGRGRESSEGGGNPGHTDINQKLQINGGTVGGQRAHIQSLRAGDRVKGRGVETDPVVTEYGGGLPTEGYAKRYLGRRMGEEETGIWQAWREGGSYGSVKWSVMEGDGEAASETGNTQVIR